MMRLRLVVEYEGGQSEEVIVGTAVFVAWEAYARRQGFPAYDDNNGNTMQHFCAYTALGIREGFDVWMRSVLGVEPKEPEASETVDPSPQGASVG